jgi:hypothetical protein
MRIHFRIASAAIAIATLAIASGCAKQLHSVAGISNRPPTVALTGSHAGPTGGVQAAYGLRWSGSDPDGRVDHYLVTDNPHLFAGTEGWTRTDETARVLMIGTAMPAGEPAGASRAAAPAGAEPTAARLPDPTFFAVRAVDDQGAVSEPAIQAFIGTNVAPTVQIQDPKPNHLQVTFIPPSVRILWFGYDPDGTVPYRLARYRFTLISQGDPDYALAITNPDSLRRKYAPDFSGWQEVPGDSLTHTFSGLTPGNNYAFVVVGFDQQGAYSPVFSLDTNILNMRVLPPGTGGPRVNVFGDSFFHAFTDGSFNSDTTNAVHVDVVGNSTELGWSTEYLDGAYITGYRWAVDILDVHDETPRRNARDVSHWSAWAGLPGTAQVSVNFPPPPSTRRFFYLEVRTDVGFMTLVVLRLDFGKAAFSQPLLVVNDTRRVRETMSGGQVHPTGLWPNAAELDSFLFARGGVPIQGYPPGSMSSPGVFSGYGFDVFETASLPAGNRTVPLDVLTRYQNVVWITDQAGAFSMNPPGGTTSLRYMSNGVRQNTLAAYAAGGGKLWIAGGGAALASSIDMFNQRRNDSQQFVYGAALDELVPGTFMYEVPRWQSELRTFKTEASLPALNTGAGGRGASGGPLALLPPALEIRSPASDPLPPQRGANQFYPNSRATDIEYLSLPNSIVGGGRDNGGGQGVGGGAGHMGENDQAHVFSLMDTVYTCRGLLPDPTANYPCMTVYHGPGSGEVVFTGFDLWTWQRSQVVAMVDAIVGNMWRQSRSVISPPVAGASRVEVAGEVVKRRK